MKRRDKWRNVLAAEVERWSAKSCDELRAELKDGAEYVVEFDSSRTKLKLKFWRTRLLMCTFL